MQHTRVPRAALVAVIATTIDSNAVTEQQFTKGKLRLRGLAASTIQHCYYLTATQHSRYCNHYAELCYSIMLSHEKAHAYVTITDCADTDYKGFWMFKRCR
eukprot:10820-Heterococcus_DN1.PRE.8